MSRMSERASETIVIDAPPTWSKVASILHTTAFW